MRLNDPVPGIIIQVDAISPEVERAQRMAELKNIAEFRSRRLQAYKDWSDPEKRAAKQAQHAKELEESKVIWDQMLEDEAKRLPIREPVKTFTLREIYKPVKKSWWQRLWDRFF